MILFLSYLLFSDDDEERNRSLLPRQLLQKDEEVIALRSTAYHQPVLYVLYR
jgi:hypothetical protein